MIRLRCSGRCAALLVGLAIGAVALLLLQRACGRFSPARAGRQVTVERVKVHDPGKPHEAPTPLRWKPAGRKIDDVPVVEPADERTRRKIEEAFGEEAGEVDFLYVGGVKEPDARPARDEPEEPDAAVDIGDLPEGVPAPGGPEVPFPVGPPFGLVSEASKAPLFDWRSLHRVEAWRQWEPDALDVLTWEANYRPYELWIKGRIYVFAEICYHQRAGESGVCGRGGVGICPGVDC